MWDENAGSQLTVSFSHPVSPGCQLWDGTSGGLNEKCPPRSTYLLALLGEAVKPLGSAALLEEASLGRPVQVHSSAQLPAGSLCFGLSVAAVVSDVLSLAACCPPSLTTVDPFSRTTSPK